jgi:DNA polymerase III subunit delta
MLAVDRQELMIISMLTRYFTILWKLSEAVQITRSADELGRTVGVASYFVQEYLSALQKYRPEQIERAFQALCEADIAIKTSNETPDIALQKALMQIIS